MVALEFKHRLETERYLGRWFYGNYTN